MSEGSNCPQRRLGSGGLGSGAVMGVQSGRVAPAEMPPQSKLARHILGDSEHSLSTPEETLSGSSSHGGCWSQRHSLHALNSWGSPHSGLCSYAEGLDAKASGPRVQGCVPQGNMSSPLSTCLILQLIQHSPEPGSAQPQLCSFGVTVLVVVSHTGQGQELSSETGCGGRSQGKSH